MGNAGWEQSKIRRRATIAVVIMVVDAIVLLRAMSGGLDAVGVLALQPFVLLGLIWCLTEWPVGSDWEGVELRGRARRRR